MIGTLLNGRFRLEEQIGSGGMSTVYRAFDETLERWVAIKLMHREISRDPAQLERFRREARAVAGLSHPHVVTVIDAGEDDGHPFIVFEYVEGETLKERIKRLGRLPVVESVAYAIEIGRALIAAHEGRLVHRDVKPQNVLIDPDGRAKVTDFGIARSLESEGLTATGRVLGTCDYVSPEQALGETVTEQSDVYSLGVCLYEMLTGSVPFRADTLVGVAMKHVREPLPDVQARRPETSATLAAIVERACAKELGNRYPSAAAMVHDLEEALGIEAARAGETTGEATSVLQALPGDTGDYAPLRLRRPRRVLALTALAGVLAAVVAVLLITRTESGSTGNAPPQAAAGDVEAAEVRLETRATSDYDPFDPETPKEEHPDDVTNVLDGQRNTVWDTQSYQSADGSFNDKPGLGIYVKSRAPESPTELSLVSPIPGYTAEVYGVGGRVPESIDGWTRLADATKVGETQEIALDTGGRSFDFFLVWITKRGEGRSQAAISELTLRRR